ncbi:MAG: T9SS type A sorting domain-containing protein [Ignavibacteria bacterium]|jgi:hypothetical protein
MNRLQKAVLILTIFQASLFAQTVYELPYNSEGNVIKLTISNTSGTEIGDIKVAAVEYPGWIQFKEAWQTIDTLNAEERLPVTFVFSVDSEAPLDSEAEIKFIVSSTDGEMWEKQITVKAGLPKEFTLNQNYPNPFNPETTISYQLPEESKVTIKIFDILGREVQTLVSEQQEAGIYKHKWNASKFASGVYICRLIAETNSGEQKIFRKKMLLLR